MIALKKILVATDFSEGSDAALAYGRELARSLGAQLAVLHVVDSTLVHPAGAGGFLFTGRGLQTTLEASAKTRLDELISDEDRTRLGAQGVIVTSSGAAFVIVEYANGSDVNVIVIGTHGRGGKTHLPLGRVAERVVRIASCSVLTVRHSQREVVRHPERDFVLADVSTQVRAVVGPPKDDALSGVPERSRAAVQRPAARLDR